MLRKLLLLLQLLAVPSFAQQAWRPGEVLVRLGKEASIAAVQNELGKRLPADFVQKEAQPLGAKSRYHKLILQGAGIDDRELARIVAGVPGVEAVSLNYLVQRRAQPNDPQYGAQWHLAAMNVEPTWSITTGGSTADGKRIAVGIIDTGVQGSHPDLEDNIAVDVFGSEEHGTQVAGVVGAVGNNGTGISGVNWDVDLVSTASGNDLGDAFTQFQFCLDQRTLFNQSNGAQGRLIVALTISWGVPGVDCGFGEPLFDDLGAAGILVVTSGPNDPTDIDVVADYPATCPNDNNIVVTSYGPQDEVPFAVGDNTVQLLAPGLDILTTDLGNGYVSIDGNSFAIPAVAGAVALLYSNDCVTFAQGITSAPEATAQQVKQAILSGVSPFPGGNAITITGGKLNVHGAYQDLLAQCIPCAELTVNLSTPAGADAQYALVNGTGIAQAQGTGDAFTFCTVPGCYTGTVLDAGSLPENGTFTVLDGGVIVASGAIADGAFSFTIGTPVQGCTDPSAVNYNPAAACDDGSCCTGGAIQVIVPAADFESTGTVDALVVIGVDTVIDATYTIAPSPSTGSTSAAVVNFCTVPGCASITFSNATIPLHYESYLGMITSGGTTYIPFGTDPGFSGPLVVMAETCDGLDNDCDGEVDENFIWYADADNDGWGALGTEQVFCVPPGSGFVQLAGDCNDSDPNVNPEMTDACATADGIDNNCDGTADEGDLLTWYPDLDADDLGDTELPVIACAAPLNHVLTGGDCDDSNSAIFPGAAESCDGLDNDCDGAVDEDFLWYTDADEDGFGDDATAQASCVPVPGAVQVGGDCDDTDATKQNAVILTVVAADEISEGTAHYIVTQGSTVIEGDIVLTFDEFSFGEAEICLGQGCFSISIVEVDVALDQFSYVLAEAGTAFQTFNTFDGFFGSAGIPAAELCDGLDNDCDGVVDEDFIWYTDADGDGVGLASTAQFSCTPIPGTVQVGGDCNDADPDLTAIGAACDDGDPNTVGDIVRPECSCLGFPQGSCPPNEVEDCNGNCAPAEWVGDGFCDDGSFEHNGIPIFFNCPLFFNDGGDCGGTCPNEACNGVDDDCDGEVDEDFIWYADADGDGFGDPTTGTVLCAAQTGMVQNGGDCDDTDATINPAASDLCDGVDRNCDGVLPGLTGNEVYSPDWTATATNGGIVNLFSLLAQGRTVVLDLFAAWCPPSQQMLSANFLQDWNAHMGPDGTDEIRIVGVAVDQSAGDLTPFINEAQWPVIVDGGASFGPLYNAIGMYENAVPTLLMICPDRSVTMLYGGPDLLPYTGQFQYDPQAGAALLNALCACRTACVSNIGCMDVNACDYDPTATCPGVCTQAQEWFVDNDGDGVGTTTLGTACAQPANSAPVSGDCDDDDPAVQSGFTMVVLTDDPGDFGTAHYVVQHAGGVIEGDLELAAETGGIGELPVCLGDGCFSITITPNDVSLFAESYLIFSTAPEDPVMFVTADGYQSTGSTEVCDGVDNDCDGQVDEGCDVRIAVRLMLEGPYNAGSGTMSDGMRALGLVPTTEPYTGLGYVHVGGGGETTTPALLAAAGDDAVVDWVLLELRDTDDPSVIVASRSALLQRDGDVVEVDGTGPVTMPIGTGSYHVAVRHRNHLGCMTDLPLALSPAGSVVDFSLGSTTTFGTNARKSITGTFPSQALWAGDVNFNGNIQYTGAGNDRDPVLIQVGSTTPNNVVSNTYSTRDVNMNGNVQYTGAGNDRDPILVNVGSTTPNNVRVQQLP